MTRAALVGALAAALAGCNLDAYVQNAKSGSGKWLTQERAESAVKTAKAFRKSAEEISESEEYFIGRAVSAQILARYKPLNDAALNFYVQKVLQWVAMSSDRPDTFKGYHVQVLDTDEVNAFAAPGGFIFITKGMLRLLKDEDELAGVLAHEVAHVARKHGLKTIQTARLTQAFTILGTEAAKNYSSEQVSKLTAAFEGAIDDIVNKLVVNGYSREKEYEADRVGVEFARGANYNPGGVKSFLARLEKESGKTGGLFKTHPPAGQRLAELGAHSLAGSADHRRSAERNRRFIAAVGL